jgi:CubicO group peptidase (beta-lactamase class C family)
MKTLHINFLLAGILYFFISCGQDQPTAVPIIPEPDPKSNNPLISETDKTVNGLLSPFITGNKMVGASIGVYKDGVFQQYGYGQTAIGNDSIPNDNTVFEVNSLSKAMTSILLTDALLKRGFTVDEPVSSFLPATIPPIGRDGQEILVRHLLNHTSGLPELPGNISGGWANTPMLEAYDSTDLFTYLKNFNLPTKPGTAYNYSNTGFGLAGVILERITGKSYEQNLLDEMCTPLSMTNTRVSRGDLTNHAKGYNSQKTVIPFLDKIDALKGSVSVRSSVKDLITYGRNQITLDSDLAEAMEICQEVSFPNPKVGLDWEYSVINGNEVISHFGGVASFNSVIYVCKSKNIVLVLLSNTDLGDDGTQFVTLAQNLAAAIIK